MKNARLLVALMLAGATVACSAAEPTGPLAESPRNSVYMGGGASTPPDSSATRPDSTKQGG